MPVDNNIRLGPSDGSSNINVGNEPDTQTDNFLRELYLVTEDGNPSPNSLEVLLPQLVDEDPDNDRDLLDLTDEQWDALATGDFSRLSLREKQDIEAKLTALQQQTGNDEVEGEDSVNFLNGDDTEVTETDEVEEGETSEDVDDAAAREEFMMEVLEELGLNDEQRAAIESGDVDALSEEDAADLLEKIEIAEARADEEFGVVEDSNDESDETIEDTSSVEESEEVEEVEEEEDPFEQMRLDAENQMKQMEEMMKFKQDLENRQNTLTQKYSRLGTMSRMATEDSLTSDASLESMNQMLNGRRQSFMKNLAQKMSQV